MTEASIAMAAADAADLPERPSVQRGDEVPEPRPSPPPPSSDQACVVVKSSPMPEAAAIESFAAVMHHVHEASLDFGVRPDSTEGKFVSAMMGAVRWTGQVSQAAQAEFAVLFKRQEDAAKLELSRVQELVKATTATFGQARSALINLQVERENLIERLTQETMPKVAEGIQKAVLVRVKDESDLLKFRRMMLSGLAALVVFLGGVGFQTWAHQRDSAPWANCLAHQQPGQGVNQGHFFCDVTAFHEASR